MLLGIFFILMLAVIGLVVGNRIGLGPYMSRGDRIAFCVTGVAVGLLFGGMLFIPICKLGGGFFPNYSFGHRSGYVTKLSVKGVFWKVNEGELQIGTGEQASLQEPFEFCATDPAVWDELESIAGSEHRVRLHYRQWLFPPYWVSDSGYEVTRVESVERKSDAPE